MRSYLSLIPISAKVRRRQNRVTLLCIVLSVFLVTAMFSAAENFVRTEAAMMEGKHGSWHLQVGGPAPGHGRGDPPAGRCDGHGMVGVLQPGYGAALLRGRKNGGAHRRRRDLLRPDDERPGGGKVSQNESEVVLSTNGKLALGVEIGDVVTVHTPTGDAAFTVSGFGADDKEYFQGQTYLVAVCMTREAFHSLMAQNGVAENPICSLQFQTPEAAAKARAELPEAYGLPAERISKTRR